MKARSSLRFPMDADDEAEARRYLENRAIQAVLDGWKCERTFEVLHPLIQSDPELAANWARFDALGISGSSWLLASEYRRIANLTLSHREIGSAAEIDLGPLREVHDMLRADKLQNQKDFLASHATTHRRREDLRRYFRLWLERLEIGTALRDRCHHAMDPWITEPASPTT